ncbi:IgA Peptidase M64 [Idiomarina sp. A28L]|uniref:hypothetical protein n=1 Tax=Idiomarina sp. A28L TaxID=1036674 RepID=UPI00021386B5|nr:hypothetical protein [Idiomarina sp. A28L]EGN76377.1 IgA Peptidase M64 [Idiomarina sp. A28L]
MRAKAQQALRVLGIVIALVLLVILLLRLIGPPVSIQLEGLATNTLNESQVELSQPRVIAEAEHCDIALNFHGQEDDFLLAQYWHQRLIETLLPATASENSTDRQSEVAANVSFCAVLRHDLYTSDCHEQLGRAWCTPKISYGESTENIINKNNAPSDSFLSKPQIHIVLTDSGLANTRNGVVFIKRNASVQVLQHELGHALGLADEYAMHPDLARQFCNGEFNFTASNLVITHKQWFTPEEMREFLQALPWADFIEQPLGTKDAHGVWRLGSSDTQKIGLFAAKTCEGTGRYAWKPVAEKTWMEQHEIGEVPALYLRLIQQHLE